MTKDALDRAARAARDVGAAAPHEVSRTRARVLESMARKARRRAPRAVWLASAATLLLAGTAWATGSTYGARVVSWIGGTLKRAPVAALTPHTERGASSWAGARLPDAGPPSAVLPPLPSADLPPLPAAAASTAPEAVPSLHPAAAARPVAARSDRPDRDALYAEAHHLHFVAHDPARALEAWDRYLAVAPSDVRAGLVLEARYNRAICLVRLGRRAEAAAALRPFADGEWDGYRQDDARALLRDIDSNGPGGP
jgi:hypothetical protein